MNSVCIFAEMQFTSSCKLHLLLYILTFSSVRGNTHFSCKLIRFFVIMISCMRCDFAERYLYLLCSFLHMCRILAGKRCLGPPHACHPFFHTFVIIADLYCRILMLFRPLHCIHRAEHFSCNVPDLHAFRITAASGFSEFFSGRCQGSHSQMHIFRCFQSFRLHTQSPYFPALQQFLLLLSSSLDTFAVVDICKNATLLLCL